LAPRFPHDAFAIVIPDGTPVALRAGNDVATPGLEWRDGRPAPVR
jgi:hypothetical protein